MSALFRRALAGAVLAVAAAAVHAQPAVPAVPDGLTVAPVARTTDELVVSWTAVAGAVTYDIDIKRGADTDFQTGVEDIGANRGTLIDLDPNTPYDVRVRASGSGGDSAWSATVEGWTHAPVEELHYSEQFGRIPRGVGPGESFRLLTVIGSTDATSTNVGTYHEVARSGVKARGFRDYLDASSYSSGFSYTEGHRALVSTPGVDARVHTDTTVTATDPGVPIYWWGAVSDQRASGRVADDYADFYDGVWGSEQQRSAATQPWTGSAADGTERKAGATSHAMGAALVGAAGMGDAVDGGPLDGPTAANTETRPVFALSHVYKVVDAPEDPPLPHPRVLLDTTLTVGEYDTDDDPKADRWGYVGPFFQPSGLPFPRTKPSENLPAGRLGGDQFLHQGSTWTLYRFLWKENGFEYNALPVVPQWDGSAKQEFSGRIGYELGTGDTAVMVALPANASEIKARESLAFHRALTDWPGAVGSEVSLRVLNLDIADIWSAVLVPGRAPGGPTGFVADGPGTLSARTFYWNGVEYTVDRLAVGASERGPGLQFATTPDLPEGLRLTVPERSDAGGRFRYPVHVYPLDRATRSAATGVDFEWPGARTAWARVGNTEPVSVYLTTPPRAQHVQRELWAATLTPGRAATATDAEPVLGYWPADELPPTEDPVTGAPGTLTPVAAQIDGVAYTVDALAMVSEADLWLRTTPPLPKGRGLVLELEVAGGVLPLSVDAAELPDYGYRWPDPFGGALSSGWDADSDDDGTLDPRRVRLVRWGTSGGVRASVSPPSAPEGGGTARVSVTATLDGAPVAADLPVTVTIGAADDTATEGDDYTASATHTLTVPAGAHSASVDVEIAVVNDSVPEPLEEISVSVEAEGRASAATAFAIEDDDHVTIEYWAAALTGAKIEFGGRAVDGYLADPQTLAPLGGELAPLRLRCCRGRQSDEPMRTVRALGRHGDDFVFAMTNLVRDGALAPEFAGAVLRVGARPLSLDRARVVELAQGAPALAWDAHLVDAPPGEPRDVRMSGPDHPVLEEVEVLSSPRAGPADSPKYGRGEVIRIALRFDEPVTITGAPALAVAVGSVDRTAAYSHGSGTREIVFAYAVVQADAAPDGIDVGRIADAVTPATALASSASGAAPVYGDLDPPPAPGHAVDGGLAPAAWALAVHDAVVGEGGGPAFVTVAISRTTDTPVTVDYATEDGTALAGSDYTAASATLTVAANAGFATVSVPILDDADGEADETFMVTLANASTGVVIARAAASVTITDDDAGPAVGIAAPTLAGTGPDGHLFEGEGALSGGAWELSAAAPVPADLAVEVRVEETGGDFVAGSGEGLRRVVIPAGSMSVSFDPIEDDGTDEPHGTVTVTVLPGDGYTVDSAGSEAAVAVRDDDFRAAPLEFLVEPADAAVLEGEDLIAEQVVRTVADGTFTGTADLERLAVDLASLQFRWGFTTLVGEADADDFTAAESTATVAAADFVPFGEGTGAGLAARRALVGVSAATDAEAEDAERFLVALERTAGSATVAQAAARTTPPGMAVPLRGRDFFRAVVTIRAGGVLTLELGENVLEEGRTTTVTATHAPPRAQAFTVTVSLPASDRYGFDGENRTLSFAPNAWRATGTVTVRAVDNLVEDGDTVTVVTGTPDAADVAPATATLRVTDDDGPRGAVLWETDLTVGAGAAEDDDEWGYVDAALVTPVDGVANQVGALADPTFEWTGVEYTVRRLTLPSSGATTGGAFVVAGTAGGSAPLVGGRAGHFADLGLEVECGDGSRTMRRLRVGTDRLHPLAACAGWDLLAHGSRLTTVRLLDLGPVTYWDGRLAPADSIVRSGYWVEGSLARGTLAPDAFLANSPGGEPVVYSVDRLALVSGIPGPDGSLPHRLEFATTPDLPPGPMSLLVTSHRTDYLPEADSAELFHVYPLTAAARSSLPGVDYAFEVDPARYDGSSINDAPVAAHGVIQRALLVPAAGVGAAAPPPVEPLEVWSGLVTVGEDAGGGRRVVGYAEPGNERLVTAEHPFGSIDAAPMPEIGLTNPLDNRVGIMAFQQQQDLGVAYFHFYPQEIQALLRGAFHMPIPFGLDVSGDFGSVRLWLPQATFDGDTFRWAVHAGHGWDTDQTRRVRMVRVREGVQIPRIYDLRARLTEAGGSTARVTGTATFTEYDLFPGVLPRAHDTPIQMLIYGTDADHNPPSFLGKATFTIPRGERGVSFTAEVPTNGGTVVAVHVNYADPFYSRFSRVTIEPFEAGEHPVAEGSGEATVPLLTAVRPFSTPAAGTGTDRRYGVGETIAIGLEFDRAVTVAGTPTLAFTLGEAEKTAAFAYRVGDTAAVFEYTVAAGDVDDDGIDVGPVATALAFPPGASIRAAADGAEPRYGDLDPAPFAEHRVDGSLTAPASARIATLHGGTFAESADSATLTLALGQAAATPMTFAYRTREIGSAVAGEDFTATRGSVTVAAGARRATFAVPILDDDLDEPDESFEVAVTMGAERVIATVIVVDDDLPEVRIAIPAIAAETGYVFEGEDESSGVVTPRANWRLTRVTAVPGAELEPLTVDLRVTERGSNYVGDRSRDDEESALGDAFGTATFAAGATTASFSPIYDDDRDEPHGVVGAWLEPGEGYVLGAAAHTGGEVAVRDDDGELVTYRFDPGALTALEGTTARVDIVIEVTADGTFTAAADLDRVFGTMLDAPVRTDYTAGTATADTDFTGSDAELSTAVSWTTFERTPSGGWTHRFPVDVAITSDSVDETSGETFTLGFATDLFTDTVDGEPVDLFDGKLVVGTPSEATITIRDAGTPTLTLNLSETELAEGDAPGEAATTTVTASLAPARSGAFDVTVAAVSNDLADDARWQFVGANRTLRFAANATASTGTVTLRTRPNHVPDGDAAVRVLATPDATTGIPRAEASLTVLDDDLPGVSIAVPLPARNGGHLFEDESAAPENAWLLTRTAPTDAALAVNVTVAESGPGDFVPESGEGAQTVTFEAGEATAASAPIEVDTVDERHGGVTVTLLDGSGYEVLGVRAAVALVRDDDGMPLVTVSLDPTDLLVAEGEHAAVDVVAATVRDGTFTEPGDLDRVFGLHYLPVVVSGTDGEATGTAGDYVAEETETRLAFADFVPTPLGDGLTARVAAVPVPVLEDEVADADETFRIEFNNFRTGIPDERVVPGARSVVTVTEGPVVTARFDRESVVEGGAATLTASVYPMHPDPFTITVTAPASDRHDFTSGELRFAASAAASANALSVTAADNALVDGDMDFDFTLTASTDAVAVPATLTLTVVDDDGRPTVSIAPPPGAAGGYLFEHEAADAAAGAFRIRRGGAAMDAFAVSLRVSDGAGDFVDDGVVARVVDAAEVLFAPVVADGADEPHGTVTVTLLEAPGYVVDAAAASASANLRDDDGTLLEVSIDAAVTVSEGRTAAFGAKAENSDGTLTAAGDLARLFPGLTAVTVNARSADGTAMADSDYTAFDGAVALDTFEAVTGTPGGGSWVGNVSLQTTEDMDTEGSEDFTVTLSLPAGTDARIALKSGDETGTATITEGPSLTLSVAPEELAEGATATVTASVEPTHDAAFTVTVAGTPVDTARWEFVGSATTLTFAANQAAPTGTVTIRAISNDDDDGDVSITLTGTPSVTDVAPPAPVVLTVLDDDLPMVSIAAPGIARDTGHLFEHEAPDNKWELTRAGLTEEALTVDLSVSDTGAFTAGAATTVTFGAGMDTTPYTPITDDTVDEVHGTVTVTVDSASGYAVDPDAASASVDVRDDDATPTLLTISLEPSSLTVSEGAAARFEVVAATVFDDTFTAPGDLDRVFSVQNLPVLVSSTDGTAMSDDGDYEKKDTTTTVAFADFSASGTGSARGLRGRFATDSFEAYADAVEDADETFNVGIRFSGAVDGRIALDADNSSSVATIVEGPSVTLTLSDDDLEEGDTATVTATVDPVHDMAFTVTLAAESNADRIAFPDGTTFNFAASAASASATLTVEAVDNEIDDGDAEVEIEATVSDAAVAEPPALELTVRDDDDPTVSIAAPAGAMDDFLYEFEAATDEAQYQWSLTRVGLTDEELIVDVSVAETGGGDFAADGMDTVTFDAGESTAAYTPITAADDVDEDHGAVTVTVDAGTGYAVDPDAASAALAVRDDDGELVTVTLDPATPTVNEGRPAQLHAAAVTEAGTFDTAAHMARLFGTVTQAEAIASTEASTGTGAATAGTDYTALAATTVALPFADFAAGDRDGVLRLRVALPAIATAEDEVTDPGETFEVKLAAPAVQDARIAVSTTAATVTINEGAIRLCSGIAASTCTDINEALATRNTEGRVEVFNDGEWGTVCDDYWSNGDGNVACTQMGYPGAERVFWSSHFGGAVKGTRTWLDNLQCVGDEDDLFDCPRLGGPAVGDHNCNGGGRHVEDAGVRCVAANTAAMGAPTITGTAQVGETLTAATTGITDADGLTSPTYTYQWIRANGTEADIASANSSTYILVAADLGKTIKVKVSFEDDASNAETLTSAATATVVAAPTAPMVTDVDVTSMPASDDTYGTGEMIRYTVTFDQAVTVVGAPEFEFCLGSSGAGSCEVGMPPPTRRRAPLSSGSGTTMLVFSYTVVEGDMDDNGIWAGDQDRTIKLEGGTIQGTVGGLDAVLTHTVVDTEADHKVNGAAANTAPTAANNTVTTGVGAAYTFEADDFGFADADAGAALASVKIVTVPAAGALALGGTAVLADAVVTKAQIDGGMLTFTPVAGASGTGYASFTFKVNDGTDDSVSAYTMTIDVAAGPTVSIAAPAGATDGFLYEFEAATEDLQYRWVLTRVGLTDAALTVDVSVAETGGGGFAADGMATVTFDAGESAAAYTPITADDLDEEHGTVTVTVDFGTGYAVDPDAASAEVDVRDDDGELVTVTLDPATLTVKEGRQAQLHAEAETEEGTFDDAADMTRLFGTVTQAEAIASTEASTGTGAAMAGTDYTALAATTVALPFADFAAGSGGVLRSRVALPAIATAEDEVTDPGETFEVKLAAPADQDARIAVSTTAATVTINEGPPGGAIRLCSGTAASTCTDVSEALATRNTQGRVEVINDGVWGTVCDDYWSNDDGQVACTQMGFAGAERVFWNSHFGGAAKGTRTWLDNLRCVGDEDDLFDCPRSGGPAVGDHNCNGGGRHVEDAGVRCLAAETAAHGAKVDPLTLTIAPGRTGRYWVSLTKDPEADVLVYPKLNTEAMAAPEVTEGPLRFPKDQWSYALDVDVTVNAGTALGTYTVTHTMDLHNNDVVSDVTELTFTVPAVTVTVAASTSVTGPAPVSATVSGRDASVRFDAPLDASFAPSAADFAVLADGRRLAVTGAWTAGRSLLLELAEPATGAVRLAYVPSAAAPLGGRDGSAVAPFEALALAAPGELADDAPDALTADAEPKLEGAPGLEAALADALRHAPGPVAATLAAPRRAVKDLTGLGALPELRRVNLAGNAVTDAGPLALLGDLERLDLSDNAVQDLWPLSGLAELRVLNLSGNRVTDVTALAGLPRLRVLELSDNAVVDLWPLGALPALEYLGLSGNRVTDVTALADLHALTRLDLGGNAVADAAPLGDVGRLVWLKLSGNRLATLDGLGRLTKLRWVWVADNPLPDGATVAWPERAWVDVAADGR